MILGELVWGAPTWRIPALVAVVTAVLVVLWSYGRADSPGWLRVCAGLLKIAGILALGVCLVEPLFSGTRPRPQANLFLLLADNSASLQIRDRGAAKTRADDLKDRLRLSSDWQARLSQEFDVRRYEFDTRLHPVEDFAALTTDGRASSLAGSLRTLAQRFQGRPTAGVLILTDGNATDLNDETVDWSQLPPIYPVVMGQDKPAADISVTRVSVSQTNFEAAPVTVLAEVTCRGSFGQGIVMQLLDELGTEVARHTALRSDENKPLVHRFQIRPEKSGVSFYRVRAFAESEEKLWEQQVVPEQSLEATANNNMRQVTVDRGGGPYRVLYVSGRANWEFKFLRRSLEEDDEIDLVGLVRIAKREAKFKFRGRTGENTNPFYRGFGNTDDEQAEQYDEPVLLRLGTEDKEELRGGFPKAADQLFRYHAVILDDVESAFFTQDQMSLLQQFVSQRGGGLLMLGGQESLDGGAYDHTPIEELLPVYLDRFDAEPARDGYRLHLTRDGWLRPWMRLRSTEQDERKRLESMPDFKTVNRLRTIKPGATVLAHVQSPDGTMHPALVAQTFGQGRSASLLIGDLWRWQAAKRSGRRRLGQVVAPDGPLAGGQRASACGGAGQPDAWRRQSFPAGCRGA